ncbi:pyridoxine 5'-phosphate oxidase C-terminal domain-containing protein [Kitasatospora sp. MAP5-34]|uniref:pyridoxine/pyridoxamine 5'-phosphate oxidase n=1 Tax=Kitasatospora sp. MAP5-34 TaxID=3035102 RepID=UPI0024770A10|nr:pyridoxine 5'-phosphate oxidase C-terminal domain-containing protein [Kitasatospora sp. MAP5-34]
MEELRRLLRERPPMARELPGFDPAVAPAEPAPLYVEWLLGAMTADVPDAQVVTVSTVGEDSHPDARMLVLRDLDVARGAWSFQADARSPMGRQLAVSPWAALTSYWPALGRQIRLRGRVEALDLAWAAPDVRGLSPAAHIATLVGRQSLPLSGPAEFERAWESAAALRERDPSTPAPGHTRYSVLAEEVEFWQGDQHRRHVRLAYRRQDDGSWRRRLLWP